MEGQVKVPQQPSLLKPSPWSALAKLEPCSLSTLMDEELAKKLDEEERIQQVPVDLEPQLSTGTAVTGDLVSSDLLLAQMLQCQLDREYDQYLDAKERHLNGDSKVSVSFNNYRSCPPNQVDHDGDIHPYDNMEDEEEGEGPTEEQKRRSGKMGAWWWSTPKPKPKPMCPEGLVEFLVSVAVCGLGAFAYVAVAFVIFKDDARRRGNERKFIPGPANYGCIVSQPQRARQDQPTVVARTRQSSARQLPTRAAIGYTPSESPPPVPAVPATQQLSLRKYFGEFQCEHCRRKWSSAHSWPGMGQECKHCKISVKPHSLKPLEAGPNADSRDLTQPHLTDLCEMCKHLGRDCSRRNY